MKNTYFENMYKAGCDYQAKKSEVEKKRSALYDEEKYEEGSALMNDFLEKNPFPFSDGAMKAFRAYQEMNYHGADAFEVEDLPWPKDMTDFVEALKAAGIKTIVVTDQSTGLMDGIYGLAASGCKMEALTTVTRAEDHRFGSSEPVKKNGIAFEIA